MQDREEIIDSKWDNFTDMDLAEMWFESKGIDVERIKVYPPENWIEGEWTLLVYVEIGGELSELILHKVGIECKADEWRYENE